jgi:hypothetical protein
MKRKQRSRSKNSKKQKLDSELVEEIKENDESFRFLSLFSELQVLVLKFLEKIDLMMARLCCKHLKQLIDEKVMLIYLDTNESGVVSKLIGDFPNVSAIR